MKKHFLTKIKNTALLLTVTFAIACPGHAQTGANYLSIFGAGGTGCSTGYDIHRMTCQVTPATTSFSNVYDLSDLYKYAPGSEALYQNSCYDKSGQLLFSVNADGIYGPDGTEVFGFGVDPATGYAVTLTYPTCYGTYTYNPTNAVSEIVIFPVPGKCNGYYVMFWCEIANYPFTTTGTNYIALRVVAA
ncbi:MAG TPA: hypothetical protein VK559_00495 [Ferruginibacter sp.]|nr:hypothetical protein [Ferruginibacter sp.]